MKSTTPKTLSSHECEILMNALADCGPSSVSNRKAVRNRLIVGLMLHAGLRVGEVVKLKIPDLCFANAPVKSLVISRFVAKNHRERVIPVNSSLSRLIQDFLDSYDKPIISEFSRYAFHGRHLNGSITCRQVQYMLEHASLNSIGRRVNPHMLRHTFASNLMRLTNVRVVQALLGHNHITSTQIYTHPNEDDKLNAINSMDKESVKWQ